VGLWYGTSLSSGAVQNVGQANILFADVPFYSGPTGVTVDQLDAYMTVAGDVAAVTRVGVYKPTNQANPLGWQVGVKWADLLADCGSIAMTGATGQKAITLGTPLVVPANTWFSVAAVDQATTLANRFRWVMPTSGGGQGFGLNFGISYSANSAACIAVYQTGVSGALPAALVPNGNYSAYGAGIGIHRSA
jgi:hypothetical protein